MLNWKDQLKDHLGFKIAKEIEKRYNNPPIIITSTYAPDFKHGKEFKNSIILPSPFTNEELNPILDYFFSPKNTYTPAEFQRKVLKSPRTP